MDPKYIHAFVLKIWLERREVQGAQPEWRGRIDHVQGGQRIYFRDLDEILPFIRSFLRLPDSAPSASQGQPEDP